jgi:hypothetical protein
MKPRNASRQLNLTLLVAVLGAVSMGAAPDEAPGVRRSDSAADRQPPAAKTLVRAPLVSD